MIGKVISFLVLTSATFAAIMPEIEGNRSKPVAWWLMIGVGMMLIQVILGGITRLTGSGLSITEWNIVTGTLPPLNEQQWLIEFGKYKQTPQYHLLNTDFTLNDFKFIFFWEWLHRVWARFIGIVFIIPFVIFLIQKRFSRQMIRPMILLFLLGFLQGTIGWIMVKSGLSGNAIYVEPTRLAVHFVFALALIAYTFWVALKLLLPPWHKINAKALRNFTWFIIFLIFIQLIFGALMSGHKAAAVAPTWPTINGSWVPSGLFSEKPLLVNLVENKITIQFIHRTIAYFLFILILIWTFNTSKLNPSSGLFSLSRKIPLVIVLLQIALGIFTLLNSPDIFPGHWDGFEWLALFHQLTGMIFLLVMVLAAFFI